LQLFATAQESVARRYAALPSAMVLWLTIAVYGIDSMRCGRLRPKTGFADAEFCKLSKMKELCDTGTIGSNIPTKRYS